GVLDLDLDISARGASPAALVGTMGGSGSLTVAEGRLLGLDLDGLTDRIEAAGKDKDLNAALDDALSRSVAKGRTPLRRLEAGFELEDGRARVRSLNADLPNSAITGTGTVDLADWMMELALMIDPEGDAPAFALALAGPVDRPGRAVTSDDLSAWLIEQAAAAIVPVEEAQPTPEPAPEPAPQPPPPIPQMADDSPAKSPPAPTPKPGGNSVIDGILDRLRR
ncbi:MAG TPA: AsmA-like C-terminal region-containing protein, partial [Arenibaculum sp.]|nr:AsmA-like C-terminal region-containing protein [Arenibaculum sp.]